ncbi:MAG: hypothetical protein ACD_75C02098G0001 [uncultured bacterium]|nr:MAG: hypothetical protein ACD_75C02098G0001 [uncultured bacterium]
MIFNWYGVNQIVMGWKDYHLHEFIIGKKRYTEDPESKDDGDTDGLFRLVDLVKQKGRTIRYLYDFGDGWEHEITIDDSRYFHPQLQAPVICLDGARACPPEDIGGPRGYFDFCQAVLDPAHEDHKQLTEWYAGFPWYNGAFNREAYDVEKVNYELMKYLRWTRDRYVSWEIASK